MNEMKQNISDPINTFEKLKSQEDILKDEVKDDDP